MRVCARLISIRRKRNGWLYTSAVLSNVLKIMTKPRRFMSVLGRQGRGFGQRGDAGVLAAVKRSNGALLSKKIVKK